MKFCGALRQKGCLILGLMWWILGVTACTADEPASDVCNIESPAGPAVENAKVTATSTVDIAAISTVDGWVDTLEVVQASAFVLNPKGQVVIPDFALGEAFLIDADRNAVERIAPRGEGPGELSRPVAAEWSAENEVVVLDLGNSRVEWLDVEDGSSSSERLSGEFVGAVTQGGELGWASVLANGMAFVEVPDRGLDDASEQRVVVRHHLPTNATDTVVVAHHPTVEVPGMGDVASPGSPSAEADARSGRLAIAPRTDRYEVEIYHPEATPGLDVAEVHFCSSLGEEAEARTAASVVQGRERFFQGLSDNEARDAAKEAFSDLSSEEENAVIHDLHVDREGRVWVGRTAQIPEDQDDALYGVEGGTYDIFSHDGQFLNTVTLPNDVRFQGSVGDTLLGLHLDGFGVPSLQLFEMIE